MQEHSERTGSDKRWAAEPPAEYLALAATVEIGALAVLELGPGARSGSRRAIQPDAYSPNLLHGTAMVIRQSIDAFHLRPFDAGGLAIAITCALTRAACCCQGFEPVMISLLLPQSLCPRSAASYAEWAGDSMRWPHLRLPGLQPRARRLGRHTLVAHQLTYLLLEGPDDVSATGSLPSPRLLYTWTLGW